MKALIALLIFLPVSAFAKNDPALMSKMACFDELKQFEFGQFISRTSVEGRQLLSQTYKRQDYVWDGTQILRRAHNRNDEVVWDRSQVSNGRSGRIQREMTESEMNNILNGFIGNAFENFSDMLFSANYRPARFRHTSTAQIIRACSTVSDVRIHMVLRGPNKILRPGEASLSTYAAFINQYHPEVMREMRWNAARQAFVADR